MVVLVNGLTPQYENGDCSEGDTHGLGLQTVKVAGNPIATVTQSTNGHEGFPPTIGLIGSPTVRAGGLPVMRTGDAYAPHNRLQQVHVDLATPQPV